MWKRLFNQTTLTGIGGWILAILPMFQEDNKMNITSWALLGIGTILVLWGVFRKELDFYDKKVILDQRQEYIPLFREVVDKMLIRLKELSVEAGALSLETYYDKYLKLNNTYQKVYGTLIQKDEQVKRKLAIIIALRNKGFWSKNMYLYELEDKDISGMVALRKQYTAYLSRTNDRSLSINLNTLFKQARILYSAYSLAEVAKKSELPLKDPKYINTLYEKPQILDSTVNYLHKQVSNRFDILLRGKDL